MRPSNSLFPRIAVTVFALFGFLSATTSAQIIHGNFTNSGVSYFEVTESGPGIPPGVFVPPLPVTSFDPNTQISQLAFAPTTFNQIDSNLMIDLKTKQSQLQINIQAAPGMWFTGDALVLDTAGSYNLVAPFGSPPLPLTPGGPTNSYAFASSTAAYTLTVTGVDNQPFVAGSPLTNTVSITPSSLDLIGPGGSVSGAWAGSVTLDINSIKTHFGIGASNKVTGMLLQYNAQVAAAGVYGQATTSLMNLNVNNAVVPEPSTYALLALAACGLGVVALRRKKRSAVE